MVCRVQWLLWNTNTFSLVTCQAASGHQTDCLIVSRTHSQRLFDSPRRAFPSYFEALVLTTRIGARQGDRLELSQVGGAVGQTLDVDQVHLTRRPEHLGDCAPDGTMDTEFHIIVQVKMNPSRNPEMTRDPCTSIDVESDSDLPKSQ